MKLIIRDRYSSNKNIFCKIFGHKITGYYSFDPPYGIIRYSGTDGTGTHHYLVQDNCDRCGAEVPVIKFHSREELS